MIGNWLFREEKPCPTCEILKESLHHERALTNQLLAKLFPAIQGATQSVEKQEAIPPKLIPWPVKRAQLEKAARVKAEELEVQKLENEMKLDIPNAPRIEHSS